MLPLSILMGRRFISRSRVFIARRGRRFSQIYIRNYTIAFQTSQVSSSAYICVFCGKRPGQKNPVSLAITCSLTGIKNQEVSILYYFLTNKFSVCSAYREAFTVLHFHHHTAIEMFFNFFEAIDINNGTSVYTDKNLRI